MKKNKEEKVKNKTKRNIDKGQIFVKIMAGILAIMMLMSIVGTLIFYIL